MTRSQPLNPKLLKKLGIHEETEEERIAGQRVIKTEIVDSMFDFSNKKTTMLDKLGFVSWRLKTCYSNIKWSARNLFTWYSIISKYRPWDIHYFLPIFVKHLELCIAHEKRFGHSTEECKNCKISTAQEAVDIIKRIIDNDYVSKYRDAVDNKWGKFPYKKTTYANGNKGYEHLAPEGYNNELHAAYEKATDDETKDLEKLGELIKMDMLNWWD